MKYTTLKTLIDQCCPDQILADLLRRLGQNPYINGNVLMARCSEILTRLKAAVPSDSDTVVVAYAGEGFHGDLFTALGICRGVEIRPIAAYDKISLWDIPGRNYIGDLTTGQVDALLTLALPQAEWNRANLAALLGSPVIAQSGVYPEEIVSALVESILTGDAPQADWDSTEPGRRCALWNHIAFYQAATAHGEAEPPSIGTVL